MNNALILKLSQKGLVLLLVPLVFGLTCFGFLYGALYDAEATAQKEEHARVLSDKSDELGSEQYDATNAIYLLYRHYGDDEYHGKWTRNFESAVSKVRDGFKEIRALLGGSSEEFDVLSRLEHTVTRPYAKVEAHLRSGKSDRMQLLLIMMSQAGAQSQMAKDLGVLTKHFVEQEEAAFQQQVQNRKTLKQLLLLAILISVLLSLILYVYFNKDTSVRLMRLLNNMVRFADKQPLDPALRGDDEIARLDIAFRKMAESITEVANNKKEFMAMLARDIRSPLNFINLSLHQLSNPPLSQGVSDKAHNSVERCLTGSTTLMRLVDDLLDVEQAESGKLQMTFEQVPISSVFDRAVKSVQSLAEEKRINFVVPSTKIVVFGDADRLVQVFINLLANAVKFSPDGSTVKIELAERGSWVRLRVIDNGPGIAASDLSRVFERFHQVETVDRRASGGTGLGLAICKEISSAHHGGIGVESTAGNGCSFWMDLPMTEDAFKAAGLSSTSSPTPERTQSRAPDRTLTTKPGKKQFSLKLTQKALILFGVPLVFGVTCFALLYGAISRSERIASEAALEKNINNHRTMLMERTIEASSALTQVNNNAARQEQFNIAVQRMHDEERILKRLSANDPNAASFFMRFDGAVMDPLDKLAQAPLQPLTGNEKLLGNSFGFGYFKTLLAPYRGVKQSFQRQGADTELLKVCLLCAMAIDVLITFALYIAFTRDTTKRLDTVLDNTVRFARRQALNQELTGDDEIAQLDEFFHQMAATITRAAEERKEFMAMIAHDVRSPLSAIVASLSLLSSESMAAEISANTRKTIESCCESSVRLLQLINDLLDVEKLDAGKLQMRFEEVPIAYVLETAKKAVRHLAEKKKVTLKISDSEAELSGDPERLVQVMVNLLTSSIENADDGTTVSVWLEDEPKWLTMRLTDTTGNPPSARAGLGWSISRHTIAAHDGTMSVEESEDKRRVLCVRLPKVRGTTLATDAKRTPQPVLDTAAL